ISTVGQPTSRSACGAVTEACASPCGAGDSGCLRNRLEKRSPSEGEVVDALPDRPNRSLPLLQPVSRRARATAAREPRRNVLRAEWIMPVIAPKRAISRFCTGVESCIEQMILPRAVDAQIFARVAFALESGPLEEANRGHISRDASGLQPVQAQNVEGRRNK